MTVPFDTAVTTSTILEMVQEAAAQLKEPQPSTLNSTSRDVQNLLAAANAEGRSTRRRHLWPKMHKRYTLTTTATNNFALPVDFDRAFFDTFWQNSQFRAMLGPLTAREWEQQKNGVAAAYPTMQFRIFGGQTNQLQLIETAASGETIIFPFHSTNWLLPETTWSASLAVTSGEYVKYLGNVYLAGSTNTTGATPPTHMSGAASDGTVSWTYAQYDRVVENGAVPLLDPDIMILGIRWRWLQSNGFDFEQIKAEHEALIRERSAVMPGASTFQIGDGLHSQFFGWENVPVTGWGS